MIHRASLFLWPLLLVGCDESGFDPPAYTAGPPIQYGCVGFADVVCDQAFPEVAPIKDGPSTEAPIALGAQFGVAGGISLSPTRLVPIRDQVFQADKEGIGALLLGHSMVHFDVRAAADIRITHEITAVSNEFTEIVGVDQFNLRIPDRFRAAPIDAEGHMLAGDIGCTWTTNNTAVVTVESDPANNIVTFRVVGPGDAVLTVAMGDLEKDVPFSIQ